VADRRTRKRAGLGEIAERERAPGDRAPPTAAVAARDLWEIGAVIVEVVVMKKNSVLRLGAMVTGIAALAALALTTGEKTVSAQVALPTPLRFVSQLDLKCYRTPSTVAINQPLTVRHLNPLLQQLPPEYVIVRELQETCVPVAKNNAIPDASVLPFARYVDLACYRIDAPAAPPGVNLTLTHLNPVLRQMGVPVESVTLGKAQQLCVPVAKNNLVPPADIRRLVQHIDLKCHDVTPPYNLNRVLNIRHLNPLLANLPPENNAVTARQRLCLPVSKNNQPIPPDVLNIIRWLDLEKFQVQAPQLPSPVPLTLRHLNPLLVNWPASQVSLLQASSLLVPVAKNNVIPPG
jgi:hypothetical protein